MTFRGCTATLDWVVSFRLECDQRGRVFDTSVRAVDPHLAELRVFETVGSDIVVMGVRRA